MSERLHCSRVVKYKDQYYVMTRMGFGLSDALRVMSRIVSYALAQKTK